MLDDLSSVEFLLSIQYAGRDFYFSTQPRVLLDERNEPIQYLGGLDIKWSDALNLFNESPSLLAVSMALFFPVDVAELVARGHELWRATGELSLWIEGRPWEDRFVLVRGSVVDPSYGAKNQSVKFSLESNGFQDRALTHPPTQTVTRTNWPLADDGAIGLYYPIVFGRPGVYQDSNGTDVSTKGSPALVVNDGTLGTSKAIIAGHEVEAQNVTVWNVSADPPVSAVRPVTLETDILGQSVSTVDALIANVNYSDGDSLFVSWNLDGGGLWNDRRNGNRTGAGELITYFLRLSTLEIDRGLWRSAETYLNQNFKFSGFLDTAVQPWKYIQQNFLPLIPVSVYATAEGISCWVWKKDAERSAAIGTIDAGGGVCRSGVVQYEQQTIVNDMRLSFALDANENKFQRSVGVVGDREPNPETERDLFSTEYSRASFYRFGPAATVFESNVVYDQATAINILQWKHRVQAFPYRVIEYDVPIRLGFLRRGDLVLINDPELYLNEELAFVRDVVWSDGKPTLSFVLTDDPPRDDHSS